MAKKSVISSFRLALEAAQRGGALGPIGLACGDKGITPYTYNFQVRLAGNDIYKGVDPITLILPCGWFAFLPFQIGCHLGHKLFQGFVYLLRGSYGLRGVDCNFG